MTKRRHEPESDGERLSAPEYKTVFVDTSLDTHLAMLASDTDTVLDFKKKLMVEHAKCFPGNGEISIHSLKVKRRGNCYHLPDFMLVSSALRGVKGNWFLSADASSSQDCYIKQKSSECGIDGHHAGVLSHTKEVVKRSFPDGNDEENIVPVNASSQNNEKTSRNWAMGNFLEARSSARMKSILENNENMFPCPNLENQNTLSQSFREESMQPLHASCTIDAREVASNELVSFQGRTKTWALENHKSDTKLSDDVVGRPSLLATTERSDLESIQNDAEILGPGCKEDNTMLTSVASEDLTVGSLQNVVSENVTSKHLERENLKTSAPKKKISKRRKHQLLHDQPMNSNPSSDYDKDNRILISNASDSENVAFSESFGISETKQSETQTAEAKDTSALCYLKDNDINEPDTGFSTLEICNTVANGSTKKKKKKSKKTALNILNVPEVEFHSKMDDSVGLCNKISEPEKKDDMGELPLHHDAAAIPPLNNFLAGGTPFSTLNEIEYMSKLLTTNPPIDVEIAKDRKRKKKIKKLNATDLYNSGEVRTEQDATTDQLTNDQEPIPTHSEMNEGCLPFPPTTEEENQMKLVDPDSTAIPPVDITALAGGTSFLTSNEVESMSKLTAESLSDVEISHDSRCKKKKKVEKFNLTDLDNSGKVHSEKQTETYRLHNEKELEPFLNNDAIGTLSEMNQTYGDRILFPPTTGKENQVEIMPPDSTAISHVGNSSLVLQLKLRTTNSLSDVECSRDSRRKKKKVKKLNAPGLDLDNAGKMSSEQETETDLPANEEGLEPFINRDPIPTHSEVNQSSGDCLSFSPTTENENQVKVDANQAPKFLEKASKRSEKVKKKARKHVLSDIPENRLTGDQNVGITVNLNNEIASNDERSGHTDSFVLPNRIEEIHETTVGTDGPTTTIETQDEEINFQHYFVAGKDRDEACTVDKVRKTSRSNEEMKTGKRNKKHALPSDSTSTEFQISNSSYEKKVIENNSPAKYAGDGKDEGMTVSPDRSNNMAHSALNSVGVSENVVKDSSPISTRVTRSSARLQKNNPAATAFGKDTNNVPNKSSLTVSGKTSVNKGTKRGQMNSTTGTRTTRKNSLLAKGGSSIFQDVISDSSHDENGKANSDASTASPLDSSQSVPAEDEINSNQFSTRNSSNDAQSRVNGKNDLSFKISAADEMTMEMILRSSNRFKKAKFLASQNEEDSQANEFVPDSQANR